MKRSKIEQADSAPRAMGPAATYLPTLPYCIYLSTYNHSSLPTNTKPTTPSSCKSKIEQAVDLVKQGKSYRAAASLTGVPYNAVREHCQDQRVSSRFSHTHKKKGLDADARLWPPGADWWWDE